MLTPQAGFTAGGRFSVRSVSASYDEKMNHETRVFSLFLTESKVIA